MADILKEITSKLGDKISEASFEGANIVLYTLNANFLKNDEGKIRQIVDEIKKRVELRADPKILLKEEEAKKIIKSIVPEEAEITDILFSPHRSIVVVEAKKPGIVIGKQGSILEEIKKQTHWSAQVQRSPAIKSKITESIRAVLYAESNYRKKFLNQVGKKIYQDWTSEKMEGWARITFLGAGRQVGRSSILLQTQESKVLLDCGIDPAIDGEGKFPYLNVSEFDLTQIDAIVLSHAHLDHSGLIPYLYKMGYKGPIYMTAPTRDIASLLALDFIGVAYKQAEKPIFNSSDVSEMVKHTICLGYGEVTDITKDIRLTFYNSGHVLGSAMVHLNIGNGFHNLLYTGDYKYARTRLLDPATTNFPRVETVITESTYGAKTDVLPPRRETEEAFLQMVRDTLDKGGKVLLPELGLGHSQETILRVEEAMRKGELPKVPMYIDGMIWDINAIHTAYPDFLSGKVRSQVFLDNNPFTSEIFSRVGSAQERKDVIEGGPCIIIATSGMLQGGASVEYFKNFAINPNNLMILSCYQGPGSLGRKLQDGDRLVDLDDDGKRIRVEVKMRIELLKGLSPHAGRNEIMSFFNNLRPKPKRIILNHGEVSKELDLASSLYKSQRVETNVPRNLETLRLR
jgi:uncharacterized protein